MKTKDKTKLNHYAIFLISCLLWQFIIIAGIKSMGHKTTAKAYSVSHSQYQESTTEAID